MRLFPTFGTFTPVIFGQKQKGNFTRRSIFGQNFTCEIKNGTDSYTKVKIFPLHLREWVGHKELVFYPLY